MKLGKFWSVGGGGGRRGTPLGSATGNGPSVYICSCGVVEYRAIKNVTPVLQNRIMHESSLRCLDICYTFLNDLKMNRRSLSKILIHTWPYVTDTKGSLLIGKCRL